MNKKIISLLICLVLFFSLSITAYATNIDAIQPDNSVIIVGVTGYDVPVYGTLPSYNAGPNTAVIIDSTHPIEGWVYTNPITGNIIAKDQTQDTTPAANEEVTPTIDGNTSTDDTTPSTEEMVLSGFQTDIYTAINDQRIANGKDALKYNFNLQAAADIRAAEVADQFSHTRPDNTEFASAIGIDVEYEVAGENLLLVDEEIATTKIIVDTWMNSEGHRNNILSKDFYETAIGVFQDSKTIYVVQLFIG